MFEDTICAPATSPVNAPIAIIRVSGPASPGAAKAFFSNPRKISPRTAHYGSIVADGDIVDDVVLVYYQAPRSFTGEDMLEIFCHGNQIIVRRILQLLHEMDIRMAEPGEFSKRAFLNGKMDLTEAEAINQVITARSQWEVSTALEQMHGSLKNAIDVLREKAIMLKADIEAGIDFSEEDIQFISNGQAREAAAALKEEISDILYRCRVGEKVSAGLNVTIAGRPNVGKSSILNLILNQERAIVSDRPGTTRDVIRESIQVNGIHVNLFDTAGIAEPGDDIERMGISLSHKNISQASIVLMVIDASTGITEQDLSIMQEIAEKKNIVLINKTDISSEENLRAIESKLGPGSIRFSARTGTGLRELEAAVGEILHSEFVDVKSTFIADVRVMNLLEESLRSSDAVIELLGNEEPAEIVAFELQSLLERLGGITGEISPDEVLGSIFSRFCIGK